MEQAKAPKYSFEYLKLADFQLEEIFGGQPQELRDNPEKFKQYQTERNVLAAQGHPTFIVDGFFGEGFRMSYFVEATLVAEVWCDKRYFVDELHQDEQQPNDIDSPTAYAVLYSVLAEDPEEMALERALLAVKEIGYPSFAKSA